jgi:hypothetical protein
LWPGRPRLLLADGLDLALPSPAILGDPRELLAAAEHVAAERLLDRVTGL